MILEEDIDWYSVRILKWVFPPVGTDRMLWVEAASHFTLFAQIKMLTIKEEKVSTCLCHGSESGVKALA